MWPSRLTGSMRRFLGPGLQLLAVVLLLPLLSGCAVGIWKAGEKAGEVSERALFGGPDAPASPGPPLNAADNRRDAVEALFTARSQAVLARNKNVFLALVTAESPAFRQRQERMYDQLAKVPLSSWSYDVVGDGPALNAQRKQELPPGAWIVRVTLHYTFKGSPSAVDRDQYFTLVPYATGWLLADDEDAAAAGSATQLDIWDLGTITVVEGTKSLVIGDASPAALLEYAKAADRAVNDVDRIWHEGWTQHAVVIVPRSQADMAVLIDGDGKGLDQIAAVTTGQSHSGPTRGDRVVVNPRAWPQLTRVGREVVMTHEVTHLATRASTYRALPMWMSEGFSDYVAYSSVDVSERQVARELLAQVRNGQLPDALPQDDDFDAAHTELGPAYEGAWLICRMIAETYGEKTLVELYLALSDTTPGPVDADLRRVLGISQDQLLADWRDYLRRVAFR